MYPSDVYSRSRKPEIVYHVHYHYNMPGQPMHSPQHTSRFNNYKSVGKFNFTSTNFTKAQEQESRSSRQSWKNHIHPDLNDSKNPEVRSSLNFRSPVKHKKNQLYSKQNSEKRVERIDNSQEDKSQNQVSINLSVNSNQEASFGANPFLSIPSIQQFNPQSEIKKFKRQKKIENSTNESENSEIRRLRLLMKSQQARQISYKMLEEQCRFLRDKFYEHYKTVHNKK